MNSAQDVEATRADLLTVWVSRAAYELIQASGDPRTAGVRAVVPLKGTSVKITAPSSRFEALEEWAHDAWKGAKRGQSTTLYCLKKRLTVARHEYQIRDCVPDPGIQSIRAAQSEQSARLRVGDVALDWDDELVQVLAGPAFYKVEREDGMYVEEDGRRYDWCYGYMTAKCIDGGMISTTHYFTAIHKLWSKNDGDVTHLKLVYVADPKCSKAA